MSERGAQSSSAPAPRATVGQGGVDQTTQPLQSIRKSTAADSIGSGQSVRQLLTAGQSRTHLAGVSVSSAVAGVNISSSSAISDISSDVNRTTPVRTNVSSVSGVPASNVIGGVGSFSRGHLVMKQQVGTSASLESPEITQRLQGNPLKRVAQDSSVQSHGNINNTSTPRQMNLHHQNPTTPVSPNLEPVARKRLKLTSENDEFSHKNTSLLPTLDLDLKSKVRFIEEQNMRYLQKIREEYNKDLMELYYLTVIDGNIMDLFTFYRSSKTHTQAYLQFLEQHRIIPKAEDIDSVSSTPLTIKASTTLTSETVIPDRKSMISSDASNKTSIIPMDVSNDMAVSSQVVQLKTDNSLNLSNIPDRRMSTSSQSQNKSFSSSNQEQIAEKAKQEAYVVQRVAELQKEGLWSEKRLPKLQEPPRNKVHWDYLLEEMLWLATDYAQERKWKKKAAKMCARMVQKHFQDKLAQAQKAEKSEEQHRRRLAGFISKEIKMFWSNAQKIVEFKQKTRLDETRKRALNQHLSFIVDQTEMYSKSLAKGMNQKKAAQPSMDDDSSRNISDDEFVPSDQSQSDDESTIAQEELAAAAAASNTTISRSSRSSAIVNSLPGTGESVIDEIEALKRESELDLEDVLSSLPGDYFARRAKEIAGKENDSDSDSSNKADEQEEDEEEKADSDSDFNCSDKEAADIEDTIDAEENIERTEGELDHKAEIDMLKDDAEMDIDELRRKYGMPPTLQQKSPRKVRDEIKIIKEPSPTTSDEEESLDSTSESSFNDEDIGLKSILPSDESRIKYEDDKRDSQMDQDQDELMDNVAALAQSIQPRGNTLSSTSVVTPVPFLLKHSLREYQHIGLDWLVTMSERKLNGILADEMGLGKTIQTIALLAHLACAKENWGPHLIVVPTSVMLNWEMEIKKWCPGFKILTYYGSQKERKLKRCGWTKPDSFHVCITSYKLVVQDHQSFRRKKWKYLILDEAQNIKNFKSQRWQMLLNFQTQQRLLLTGTPLQNNLMELWSLMHFLMPDVFQSHREFKEWFSNPVSGMIEGNSEYNEGIIRRLHKVLRPFLLRRLKSEVEKQMPRKFEHVVLCRLSKRQRFLYDDFMCRAKTKETLASGNLLSVINVLMQLRKVCNHPNLFETRPTISPFLMPGLILKIPSLVYGALEYDPMNEVDLNSINMSLLSNETRISAFVAHRMSRLCTPRKLIEEMPSSAQQQSEIKPPSAPYRLFFRVLQKTHQERMEKQVIHNECVAVGTSPAVKAIKHDKDDTLDRSIKEETVTTGIAAAVKHAKRKNAGKIYLNHIRGTVRLQQSSPDPNTQSSITGNLDSTPGSNSNSPRPGVNNGATNIMNDMRSEQNTAVLTAALVQQMRHLSPIKNKNKRSKTKRPEEDISKTEFYLGDRENQKISRRKHRLSWLHYVNRRKCHAYPLYGEDLRQAFDTFRINNNCKVIISRTYERSKSRSNKQRRQEEKPTNWLCDGYVNCLTAMESKLDLTLKSWIRNFEDRANEIIENCQNYVMFVQPALALSTQIMVSHPSPSRLNYEQIFESTLEPLAKQSLVSLHPIQSAGAVKFPEARLVQYDCGKLQILDGLLRQLKRESHRVLIFTQMTRMLDVLEAFLNYHGHVYLRLDGTTKVDQRQVLMERFNNDKRIFVFILSTRSGGVGVNLTGADTVIFYDSDWNPTMDAQAQDRCHRIGQTKDVHIYRLVSEKTIEENILKKANQKRLLGDLAIEGGNFTTAYFKSQNTIQDLFTVDSTQDDASQRMAEILEQNKLRMEKLSKPDGPPIDKTAAGALESAMNQCEDDQDAMAAKTATAEISADLEEFDESIPIGQDNEGLSKAEIEVRRLLEQLNPLEKYAMNFLEQHDGGSFSAEQLALAEAEIEEKRLEWEKNRLEALRLEQMELDKQNEDLGNSSQDILSSANDLTYPREDSLNQEWIDEKTLAQMPLWCPPTPPQGEGDIYIDANLQLLYDTTQIMMESELPPVYQPPQQNHLLQQHRNSSNLAGGGSSNKRKLASGAGSGSGGISHGDGRRPSKYQRFMSSTRSEHLSSSGLDHQGIMHHPHHQGDGSTTPSKYPKSLFTKPVSASSATTRAKRDAKLRYQQYQQHVAAIASGQRGLHKGNKHLMHLESDVILEWLVYEDWALLQAITKYQGLPLLLEPSAPGHTVNWDLVSDMVNAVSRVYRSTKQCRLRYENVLVPRELGMYQPLQLANAATGNGAAATQGGAGSKRFKKNGAATGNNTTGRGAPASSVSSGAARSRTGATNQTLVGTHIAPQPRTEQLVAQDSGAAFARLRRLRIENIKSVTARKQSAASIAATRHQQSGVQGTAGAQTSSTQANSHKHALVLQDFGINYDMPLKPEEVAQRRADRIAKEKQKQSTLLQQQLQQQQQQTQQQNQQQQQQNQQQQVKSQDVASGSTGVAAIKYLQQQKQEAITTVVGIKQQQQSISLANAPIIIQQSGSTGGTVVVSQQQLQQAAGAGGVLVASGLRAQRIVTPSSLQEALRHRVLSQQQQAATIAAAGVSGGVVTVGTAGGGVTASGITQAQLQARLHGQLAQQTVAVVSKCVTGGIATSVTQQVGVTQQQQTVGVARNVTPTQLLLYKQRALAQHVQQQQQQRPHLLHAVQAGSPQIIASLSTGPAQTGQKVSIASFSSLGAITVAQPGRAQVVKQLTSGAKQAIARQLTEADVTALLLKKQIQQQQLKNAAAAKANVTSNVAGLQAVASSSNAAAGGASTAGSPLTAAGGTAVRATAQQFRQLQQQVAALQRSRQQQQGKQLQQLQQHQQVVSKAGTTAVPTQLVLQQAPRLAGTQHVVSHQVIGRVSGGTPLILGKVNQGVARAQGRQTIQVVSATSGLRAAGALTQQQGLRQTLQFAQIPGHITTQVSAAARTSTTNSSQQGQQQQGQQK